MGLNEMFTSLKSQRISNLEKTLNINVLTKFISELKLTEHRKITKHRKVSDFINIYFIIQNLEEKKSFSELQRYTEMSSYLMKKYLSYLVSNGFLSKKVDFVEPSSSKAVVFYELTDKGRELISLTKQISLHDAIKEVVK